MPSNRKETADPTQGTICSVTNSTTLPVQGEGPAQTSWNGSIVAINAYNTSATGTQQGYGQTLALLPFTGGNTLATGATDTITLNQTVVVNGKTINVTLYDLIFAQSNNLFPVLVQSESLPFQPPYNYPAIPVPAAASSASANALLFLQDINCFPTSTVAKNFQSTVNNASTSAASSGGMTAAINAFFATTKDFQNVTFDSYIAVSTYIYNFAFAWANFASTYTYYLYQSSGSTPSQGGGATPMGTVTLTSNGTSGVPSLTDNNGGYTITYTDESGNTTPLYFNSQQLVSAVGSAAPAICLAMNYMQLSQFTGQSTDAATLVPVAFGNLNGVNVIGVFTEKPTDSGFLTSVENFFNSKGMQLILQVLGLIMGIKMLCDGANWLRNKFKSDENNNGGDPVSPEEAAANRQQEEEVESDMESELSEVDDRLGSSDESEISSDEDGIESEEDEDEISEQEEEIELESDSEQEQLNEEESELSTEAEIGVNPDMQQVAQDVRSEQSDLDNLDPTNISASEKTLSNDESTISNDQTTLDKVNTEDEQQFTQAEKDQTEEDEELEEDEQEEQKEEEDADDEASEGDDVEDLGDL